MTISIISLLMVMSFNIGPSIGAFVPVQEENGPWGTSFLFGVAARYGFSFIDLEADLQFTEMSIDPDSSRGFDYSMIPFSLGISREILGLRLGTGGALYSIEATLEADEGFSAVWKGTFPGIYLSIGKDMSLLSHVGNLSARFNFIDFDGIWIGLSGSFFF